MKQRDEVKSRPAPSAGTVRSYVAAVIDGRVIVAVPNPKLPHPSKLKRQGVAHSGNYGLAILADNDYELADVLGRLRDLHIPFLGGGPRSPAGFFESLRAEGGISGTYSEIHWPVPTRFAIRGGR